MNNYYYKYVKYKIKYMDYKDKNGKKFKEFIKSDIYNGLLNIDFLHDNPKKSVKNNIFYDMINEKEIIIYNGTIPENIEYFLHNQLIDFNDKESIFNNKFSDYTQKIDITQNLNKVLDLQEYVCVLDKSVNNKEMELKLSTIFNITNFEPTFIGNCELFLNNNTTILQKFLTPSGKLKSKYLIEAIKIGFLPKSINNIINFKSLKCCNDILYKELKLIELYIDECVPILKKIKTEFYKKYLDDLLKIKQTLIKIKNIDDINKYYDIFTKKLIEKIVFSMKESRDIYYIEEIKNLIKKNPIKKYILITGDLIQSYRCIISNISTINTVLSIIRFIALYYNGNLNIIGNPFELLSNKKEVIKQQFTNYYKRELISKILLNPIITLRNNIPLIFNNKYIYNNYDNIYKLEYLKYLSKLFVDDYYNKDKKEYSSIEYNVDKKKKEMDYLLNFSINNIKNEDDLIYILTKLKIHYNYSYNDNMIDFAFDSLLRNIDTLIERNTKDEPINKDGSLNIMIKETTWQYNIFYLTTLYEGFCMLEYLIPLTKKIYGDYFDWNEIENLIN
jgi:hypothetical protein